MPDLEQQLARVRCLADDLPFLHADDMDRLRAVLVEFDRLRQAEEIQISRGWRVELSTIVSGKWRVVADRKGTPSSADFQIWCNCNPQDTPSKAVLAAEAQHIANVGK